MGKCSPGFYYDGTASTCVGCPQGRYSEVMLIQRPDECKGCRVGTFNDETGVVFCKVCGAGKFANSTNETTCSSCLQGKYSLAGAMVCTSCAAGKIIDSASGYSTDACGGNCDLGRYRTTASTKCTLCVSGRYQDQGGQADCKLCPNGKFGNGTGYASVQECQNCPVNTYSSASGLDASNKCSACPAGRSSTSTGLTAATQCTRCAIGRFTDINTGSNPPCAKGQYQDEEGQTQCKSCPTGRFGNVTGAVSDQQCQKCPVNTYSSASGLDASSKCSACPAGRSSTSTGLTAATQCTKCAKGRFANANTGSTAQCTEGQYQDEEGQTQCKLCPAGRYGKKTGSSSLAHCHQCPAGSFSVAGQQQCLDCPSGMISRNPASQQCTQCPLPKVPNALRSTCICPSNSYLNTNDTCVSPCPLGVDCTDSGSTLERLQVDPGWWRVPHNTSTEVQTCPMPGTCLGGSDHAKQCANGTTGILCALCLPNYYHNSDDTACLQCPSSIVSLYFLLGGVFVLLCIVLYLILWLNRGKGQQGFVRPLISLTQNLSIVMMYNAPWPPALLVVYQYSLQFQVDFVSFVSPACLYSSYYTHFILVLLFFTAFAAIAAGSRWRSKREAAIRDLFIGVLLFYPGITGMALRFFRCRRVGETSYLIADLHLQCYDSTWWTM